MTAALKQRIVTGSIVMLLFVLAVWFLPTIWFALLTGIIIGLAAWEWTRLAGIQQPLLSLTYVVLVAVLLVLLYSLRDHLWSRILLGAAAVGWLLVLPLLVAVERRWVAMPRAVLVRSMLGILVLLPGWLSLLLLHNAGPTNRLVLYFLVALVVAADIGAYFAGHRWGSRKLAPRISPGKTWQGLAGGVTAALLVAVGYTLTDNIYGLEILYFMLICLITVSASVLGDLLVSLMKRIADRKDSGTLLPGHGGVLDRIDSLTAAGPVFLMLLWSVYS